MVLVVAAQWHGICTKMAFRAKIDTSILISLFFAKPGMKGGGFWQRYNVDQ